MAAFVVVPSPEITAFPDSGARLGIFPGSATPAVFPARVPFWIGYGFVPEPTGAASPPKPTLDERTRFELDVDGSPGCGRRRRRDGRGAADQQALHRDLRARPGGRLAPLLRPLVRRRRARAHERALDRVRRALSASRGACTPLQIEHQRRHCDCPRKRRFDVRRVIGSSLAIAAVLTFALTSTGGIAADTTVAGAPEPRNAEPAPVASLEPAEDEQALAPPRRVALAPGAGRRPTVVRSRRLLRGHRLPPSRDEARGDRIAVRAVLRVDSSTRRGQDEAAAERGRARPCPRLELPRDGRDPLRDVDEVGREHGLELVHGRSHRARAHGRRRLRREQGRHLGGQRAHVGGPARHGERARQRPRAPARAVRGRRARRRAEPSSSSASDSGRPTPRSTRRTSRTGTRTPRSGRT